MEKFQIKNFILVISYSFAFCVALYSLGVWPSTYPITARVDMTLLVALRYSIPLLVLLFPIRRLYLKLFLYTAVLLVLAPLISLPHLSDAQGLVYVVVYFPLGLFAVSLLHFLLVSRFTQSLQFVATFTITTFLLSLVFSFLSVSWTKTVVYEYAKSEAYEYLRCKGDSMDYEAFQNMCDHLTGAFWQPYYQDICFAQAEKIKSGNGLDSNFKNCRIFIPDRKFSNSLMDHWGFRSAVGLPK